jgi:hypothetical protein
MTQTDHQLFNAMPMTPQLSTNDRPNPEITALSHSNNCQWSIKCICEALPWLTAANSAQRLLQWHVPKQTSAPITCPMATTIYEKQLAPKDF